MKVYMASEDKQTNKQEIRGSNTDIRQSRIQAIKH